MEQTLSTEERKLLLKTAREAIEARLAGRKPSFPEPTLNLKKKCGAFVTLTKQGKLRGCIGFVIAAKPLMETVKEAAQSSAFHDPRFPHVNKQEAAEISIDISVLSPPRRIQNIDEIRVGTHGIIIRQGFRSGLLLPQVAEEYGWDRDTFLTHTCYKAGLPGDCWKAGETEIEIFSAEVFGEQGA